MEKMKIPPSVQSLLDFVVKGFYKQTDPPGTSPTASSLYIKALEKTVDDLKDVVRGLYDEREKAAKRLQDFIHKWEKSEDKPDAIEGQVVSSELAKDPSEYVAGL